MVYGNDLSSSEVEAAIRFNRARFSASFLPTVRVRLGLPEAGGVDEAFVREVASWQEESVASGAGDGKIGDATEAYLNLQLPEAQRAADAAERMRLAGNVLFDSWGNDMRDNNLDGVVDEPAENTPDGAHYGRVYRRFDVRRGQYEGGWGFPGYPRRTLEVGEDAEQRGAFRYGVCSQVVSDAYYAAGVMPHHDATGAILREFRVKGYVWRRSEARYPSRYLPGDFICTWAPGGGHSGIIVEASESDGGSRAPTVIELPGPSSQMSDGTYDPRRTSDIVRHAWSDFRMNPHINPFEYQYLARLLRSRLRQRRR